LSCGLREPGEGQAHNCESSHHLGQRVALVPHAPACAGQTSLVESEYRRPLVRLITSTERRHSWTDGMPNASSWREASMRQAKTPELPVGALVGSAWADSSNLIRASALRTSAAASPARRASRAAGSA